MQPQKPSTRRAQKAPCETSFPREESRATDGNGDWNDGMEDCMEIGIENDMESDRSDSKGTDEQSGGGKIMKCALTRDIVQILFDRQELAIQSI